MSNNITVNVGSGGECEPAQCCTAPCTAGNFVVTVEYSTQGVTKTFGPLTYDAAVATLQVLAGRTDVLSATIGSAS